MRGMARLKDYCDKQTYAINYDRLFAYGQALVDKQGWIMNYIEGGCISPDFSTIFIFNRDPYWGELMQFSPKMELEFSIVVDALMETGDFERNPQYHNN